MVNGWLIILGGVVVTAMLCFLLTRQRVSAGPSPTATVDTPEDAATIGDTDTEADGRLQQQQQQQQQDAYNQTPNTG